MGVIIYSLNWNNSPKVSYGVLKCDIVIVTEFYAYGFIVKDFVTSPGWCGSMD